MEYRIQHLRKDEFHSLAKSFAKTHGIELNQIAFNGDYNSDKIITILQDDFLARLTDEQRKELSDFNV